MNRSVTPATPHDHDHKPIGDEGDCTNDYEVLERAVRELLIENGVLNAADITHQIEDTDSRHPGMGARVVAKAWVDPDFRAFLIRDAKAAVESLGIEMSNSPSLIALENTPEIHHVVVCTLCSCYPRKLLGVPPAWYKSRAYRSRVVNDPRSVLSEFGTSISEETEIRVADSTADVRYIVIPERPKDTVDMSEGELAGLVTRDAMIGVTLVGLPKD